MPESAPGSAPLDPFEFDASGKPPECETGVIRASEGNYIDGPDVDCMLDVVSAYHRAPDSCPGDLDDLALFVLSPNLWSEEDTTKMAGFLARAVKNARAAGVEIDLSEASNG